MRSSTPTRSCRTAASSRTTAFWKASMFSTRRLRELGTARTGIGADRFRAGVRVDHRVDPGARRRRDRRPGRRDALVGRQRADLRGQHSAEHGHRPVGPTLPGVARVVCVGSSKASAQTVDSICAPTGFARSRRHLHGQPSVVFATEPMDDAARWRLLEPGELVHVDAGLQISRDLVLPDPPRHLLRAEELSPAAQASLHPTAR